MKKLKLNKVAISNLEKIKGGYTQPSQFMYCLETQAPSNANHETCAQSVCIQESCNHSCTASVEGNDGFDLCGCYPMSPPMPNNN